MNQRKENESTKEAGKGPNLKKIWVEGLVEINVAVKFSLNHGNPS